MILDIQKGVFSIKVILELKELFQKLSCVEDIVISETMNVCNVIAYKLVKKHVLILYENLRRMEMLGVPIP